MRFFNIILYFLLWVAITTAVFFLLPRGFMLVPAIGGLGLWFWLNRDR